MPGNALYTDLSAYYDLMCADIDYGAQSRCIQRLQQLFGNAGNRHLDLACGTGPHVRHFIDAGFTLYSKLSKNAFELVSASPPPWILPNL